MEFSNICVSLFQIRSFLCKRTMRQSFFFVSGENFFLSTTLLVFGQNWQCVKQSILKKNIAQFEVEIFNPSKTKQFWSMDRFVALWHSSVHSLQRGGIGDSHSSPLRLSWFAIHPKTHFTREACKNLCNALSSPAYGPPFDRHGPLSPAQVWLCAQVWMAGDNNLRLSVRSMGAAGPYKKGGWLGAEPPQKN